MKPKPAQRGFYPSPDQALPLRPDLAAAGMRSLDDLFAADRSAFTAAAQGCAAGPGLGERENVPVCVQPGGRPGSVRVSAGGGLFQVRTASVNGAWMPGPDPRPGAIAPIQSWLRIVGDQRDPRPVRCVYDYNTGEFFDANHPESKIGAPDGAFLLPGMQDDENAAPGGWLQAFGPHGNLDLMAAGAKAPEGLSFQDGLAAGAEALRRRAIWVPQSAGERLKNAAAAWSYPVAAISPGRAEQAKTCLGVYLARPDRESPGPDGPGWAKYAQPACTIPNAFASPPVTGAERPIVAVAADLAGAIEFAAARHHPDPPDPGAETYVAVAAADSGHVAVASGLDEHEDRLAVLAPLALIDDQPPENKPKERP